jgi:peptidoglycan-associated lipoprotein
MKRMWMLAAALVLITAGAGCSKKVDTLRSAGEDEGPGMGVQKESGMMTEDLDTEMVAPEVAEAPEMPASSMSSAAMSSDAMMAAASRLQDIHFDFDKAVIRDPDKPVLMSDADVLKANPMLKVVVEGHADERGTTAYNLALGERRANATRRYLIALGVSPGQLATVSYGEERPLCTQSEESCWSRNRRAHMTAAR